MIKDVKVLEIVKQGMIVNYRYELKLIDDRGCRPERALEVPAEGLLEAKYLKQLRQYSVSDLKTLQADLETSISKALERGIAAYRFVDIGWNTIDDKPVFAFSNCCVTQTGLNYGSYADVEGFDLMVSENFEPSMEYARMRFLELMNILEKKPDILYPVFFMNIAALLNHMLGKKGRAPSLIMWLGGRPGSGKTELACALGSFINKDIQNRAKIARKLFSAFGRPRDMNLSLFQHKGLVFILDDAKKERAQGQRENTRTCIDICIRSVKSQKLLESFDKSQRARAEEGLDAGAIITGEYMDIYQSSMARMVYLEVDDLINNTEYSQTLRRLQDNPHIFSDLMTYIIQYLCCKYLDETYWGKIVKIKDDLWEEDKKLFYGTNQSRFADSMSSLQLTARLVADCAMECGAVDSFDVKEFLKQSDRILAVLMKRTAFLINEKDEILLDAYKVVLSQLKLQSPIQIYSDSGELQIEPYIIEKDMDGVWIPDINAFVETKSDTKSEIESSNKCPAIVCRVNNLIQALIPHMIEIAQQYNYIGYWSVKVDNTRLREAGIICGELRSDKTFNNQFSYLSEGFGYGSIDETDCICLNLNNAIIKPLVEEFQKQESNGTTLYLEDMSDGVYDKIVECQRSWQSQFKRSLKAVKIHMEGR